MPHPRSSGLRFDSLHAPPSTLPPPENSDKKSEKMRWKWKKERPAWEDEALYRALWRIFLLLRCRRLVLFFFHFHLILAVDFFHGLDLCAIFDSCDRKKENY